MRLEHGLKPGERVIMAHVAYLVKVHPARLTRCDGDGPSDSGFSIVRGKGSEKEDEQTYQMQASAPASCLIASSG